MRFVQCDREQCRALFPVTTPHSLIRVFDDMSEHVRMSTRQHERELCPACRVELDAWFGESAGPGPLVMSTDAESEVSGSLVLTPESAAGLERAFVEAQTKSRDLTRGEPRPAAPGPADIAEAFDPAPVPDTPPPRARKTAPKRTCVQCGREGFRRFKLTHHGWICTEHFIERQTGQAPAPTPQPAAKVTAQCQDCTRSFVLTGDILRRAVEMHELKRSHVVDVYDETARPNDESTSI